MWSSSTVVEGKGISISQPWLLILASYLILFCLSLLTWEVGLEVS